MTLVSKTPINDIFLQEFICIYMCLNVCITCIDEVKKFTSFFDICKYYLFFILENHTLFSFYHFLIIRFFFQPFNIKIWTFHIKLTRFSIRLLFISKITFTQVIQRVYQPETRSVRFC